MVDVDSDSIPVVIYAHRKKDGEYVYVGASTNLGGRWSRTTVLDIVVLESTTLKHQVERETFWIEKLRSDGYPLLNVQKPKGIASKLTRPGRLFHYEYPRPSVTVDAVVFGVGVSGLSLLLIQRAGNPFKGDWALPGGFVNMDEDLETAAKRELLEETGMKPAYMEQLYTFGSPSRDPRGRVIDIAYLTLVKPADHPVKASSDAKDVRWFQVESLPSLAFDHRDIVDKAITRLRAKVRYAPIGFDLLPDEFTLSDFQALYEILLQRTLDKRNFRKKILGTGLLSRVGETTNTNPPSTLYRFNKDEYERQTRLGINFEI